MSSNDEGIKDVLLDYIYDKIDVGAHRYVPIQDMSNIYPLKIKKHYVTANSCGINSFMIFTKKNNKHYNHIIDRRSISYKRSALDKSIVRITQFKSGVDIKYYDGTIFDGILLNSNLTNNDKQIFIITDVFNLCGKNMLQMDYKIKMNLLLNFLPTITNNEDIELVIHRPYEINQIQTLFQESIKNDIKKYNIKGITFFPEFSDKKLIYIFDKSDDITKNKLYSNMFDNTHILIDNSQTNNQQTNNQQTINQQTNNSKINNQQTNNSQTNNSQTNNSQTNKNNLQTNNILINNDVNDNRKKILKFYLTDAEIIDDIILNFEMCKTQTFDVFRLYAIFYIKNVYIKKHIGIAHIPTFELSLQCKKLFENETKLFVECKFDIYKNRWIPVKKSSINKIDIINIDSRIRITEEYENDNNNNEIEETE